MVDLAEPGARIAAGISTRPVSSDDGPHLVSRKDALLAPGIKNGGFGTENDSGEHGVAGNLCEHSVWNRRAVGQRGRSGAFKFRIIERGGDDVVVTGTPLLGPQSLVEWFGAVAGSVGLRGEGPTGVYETFDRVVLHRHGQMRADPGAGHLHARI